MDCHAQRFWEKSKKKATATQAKPVQVSPISTVPRDSSHILEYIIEDGDTIYIDHIKASKVYSRLPKQKGKD